MALSHNNPDLRVRPFKIRISQIASLFFKESKNNLFIHVFLCCVFVSRTRRDLQEVKEELLEERTKRQALQVSGASVKNIHCTSFNPLIFFCPSFNYPFRKKCTVWRWDIKHGTGCLAQTRAPELSTKTSVGQMKLARKFGETWLALLHRCTVLFLHFYILFCRSYFDSKRI